MQFLFYRLSSPFFSTPLTWLPSQRKITYRHTLDVTSFDSFGTRPAGTMEQLREVHCGLPSHTNNNNNKNKLPVVIFSYFQCNNIYFCFWKLSFFLKRCFSRRILRKNCNYLLLKEVPVGEKSNQGKNYLVKKMCSSSLKSLGRELNTFRS